MTTKAWANPPSSVIVGDERLGSRRKDRFSRSAATGEAHGGLQPENTDRHVHAEHHASSPVPSARASLLGGEALGVRRVPAQAMMEQAVAGLGEATGDGTFAVPATS